MIDLCNEKQEKRCETEEMETTHNRKECAKYKIFLL